MVGGARLRAARRSTSPPRASASRARRSSPSCSPTALRAGHPPGSVVGVAQADLHRAHSGGNEKFVVNNYEGNYAGVDTLAGAHDRLRQLGLRRRSACKVGTKRIARLARRMGIRTPVSRNPAMTLGGLQAGRHAARHGARLRDVRRTAACASSGTLGAPSSGPVGIREVDAPEDGEAGRRRRTSRSRARVLSTRARRRPRRRSCRRSCTRGTGKRAPRSAAFAAGKTGTTENYGDAWFVGFNDALHGRRLGRLPRQAQADADRVRGRPVAGGTFPALIWHDFMTRRDKIIDDRSAQASAARKGLHAEHGGADDDRADARRRRSRRAAPAEGGDGPAPPSQRRRRRRRRRRRAPAPRPTQPHPGADADAGDAGPDADAADAARRRRPRRRRTGGGAARGGGARRAAAALGRGERRAAAPAATAARRGGCRRRRSATAARPPS